MIEDTGTKTLLYLYDFGDGWEHSVKIERILDPVPGLDYPVLLEAKGRCPPEDVGGPPGYAEFLEAIADPGHERHAEFAEWHSEDFNPNEIDIEAITEQIEALVEEWSRKPRAKKSRRS